MNPICQDRMTQMEGFIAGELFREQALTLEQLDVALDRQLELMAHGRTVRLGDLLAVMGFISEVQLSRALARQRRSSDPWAAS